MRDYKARVQAEIERSKEMLKEHIRLRDLYKAKEDQISQNNREVAISWIEYHIQVLERLLW